MPLEPPRLDYPVGRPFGFNVAHPASQLIRASCIASGANMVQGLTGAYGTTVAGTASVIDGIMGPACHFGASAQAHVACKASPIAAADPAFTIACILKVDSIVGVNQAFLTPDEGLGVVFYISTGGFFASGTLSFNVSNIPCVAGVPYFVAVSFSNGSASTPCDFTVTNLQTGQVFQNSVTANCNISTAPNPSMEIGNYNFANNPLTGSVAAAMWCGRRLSQKQMHEWALDPWSFWYPQDDSAIVGVAAATGTGVLASAGTGAASWVGAAQDAAVLSSAGTGAGSWVSSAIDAAVLSAAGTGAAAWVGNSVAGGGALSAAGLGAANWVSAALSAAVLNAAGQGAFNGASPVATPATTAMAGSGSARFIGAQSGGATGFEYPPGYGRYGSGRATKPWLHDDGFVDEPDL